MQCLHECLCAHKYRGLKQGPRACGTHWYGRHQTTQKVHLLLGARKRFMSGARRLQQYYTLLSDSCVCSTGVVLRKLRALSVVSRDAPSATRTTLLKHGMGSGRAPTTVVRSYRFRIARVPRVQYILLCTIGTTTGLLVRVLIQESPC